MAGYSPEDFTARSAFLFSKQTKNDMRHNPLSPTKRRTGLTASEAVILQSVGNEIVNISVNGESEQIGNVIVTDDEEKQRMLVGMQLAAIARLYGSSGPIAPDVMAEATTLVLNSYSDFSLEELKHAFRFAATDKDGKVTAFNQQINVEWFSRTLRFWKIKKSKIKTAMLQVAKAEEAKIEVTGAERRKQKHAANLDTINRIVNEYEKFLYSNSGFQCRIYWFQFLEKAGVFSVETASKNRAMVRSKTETIRQLKSQIDDVEKRGNTFSVDQIAKVLKRRTDGEPQKTEAVRRIMAAFFHRMHRRNIEPSELERMLVSIYEKRQDELTTPLYRVVTKLKNGKTGRLEDLSKSEALRTKTRALSLYAGKIKSVKIEIQ